MKDNITQVTAIYNDKLGKFKIIFGYLPFMNATITTWK